MAIRRVTIRRAGRRVGGAASRGTSKVVGCARMSTARIIPITDPTDSKQSTADKEKLEALQKNGITKASVEKMNKKKAEKKAKKEAEDKVKAQEKKKEAEEKKLTEEKKKKEADEKKAQEASEKMAAEARRRKMREQMVAAMVAHYTKVPEEYEKQINIVTQADGVYEVRINRIGEFITKTASVKIPGGESKLKQGFVYKLPRKIPLSFLLHTIDFFKVVNTHYGSEAYQQYFWDEESGKFFMHYPIQDCSGGHVDYTRDPELEQNKLLIMDIHSHNTMGAFFSGVDDADEKENRIFGVIGKVTQKIPDMKFRISSAGKHVIIHPLKIFDVDHIDDEVAALPEDQQEEAKKKLEELAEALRNFNVTATSAQSGNSYWGGSDGRWGGWQGDCYSGDNYNRRSGAMNYGGGSSYQSTPKPQTTTQSSGDKWSTLDSDQVYLIERSDDVERLFKEIIIRWDKEQLVELIDLMISCDMGDLIELCLNCPADSDNDEDEFAAEENDDSAGIEVEAAEPPREFVDIDEFVENSDDERK